VCECGKSEARPSNLALLHADTDHNHLSGYTLLPGASGPQLSAKTTLKRERERERGDASLLTQGLLHCNLVERIERHFHAARFHAGFVGLDAHLHLSGGIRRPQSPPLRLGDCTA
jgi:hypothetical protein